MISCRTAEQFASQSLDGQATAAEEQLLAAHLADCPACRDYRNRLAELDRNLADATGELLAAVTKQSISIPKVSPRQAPRRMAPWLTTAIAAAACLLIGGTLAIGLLGWMNHVTRPTDRTIATTNLAQPPAVVAANRPATPPDQPARFYVFRTVRQIPSARGVMWDNESGVQRVEQYDREESVKVVCPDSNVDIEWAVPSRAVLLTSLNP